MINYVPESGAKLSQRGFPAFKNISLAEYFKDYGDEFNGSASEEQKVLIASILRRDFIHNPAPREEMRQLDQVHHPGEFGQAQWIDQEVYRGSRNRGFFIEAGADDGETTSNTLLFETQRGWSGLLVEPNCAAFKLLLEKRRRVFALNACLAIESRIAVIDFVSSRFVGGIKSLEVSQWVKEKRREFGSKISEIICFPLFAVLIAMGNPTVDLFSLDVEASEERVLEFLPFDQVFIKAS